MPFFVFDIGSALMVLGFSLKVLQVTSRLTITKSGAETRIRNIGITSIVVGLLICLVVLVLPADERNSVIIAGLNIAVIGLSTLIQYKFNPKNEKVLSWAAVIIIIVGFLLWVAYVLTHL